MYLIRDTGYLNQAFDDILAFDINNEFVKPGTLWDDIESYIQDYNLENWALTENDDEADAIMDDEDEEATKSKHIRITI